MRICSIEGCGRKYSAKGLCRKHYNLSYNKQRYKDPIKLARMREQQRDSQRRRRADPIKNERIKEQRNNNAYKHYWDPTKHEKILKQKCNSGRKRRADPIKHARINEQCRNSACKRRADPKTYEKMKKGTRNWQKKNPHKVNALAMKRIAKKLHATPLWLTKDQLLEIEGFYLTAHTLTVLTGIQYDVDHIYPLQGKTCTGLHVPWNLRVITHEENVRKGAKLIGEY